MKKCIDIIGSEGKFLVKNIFCIKKLYRNLQFK